MEWQPIETVPMDGSLIIVYDDQFEPSVFCLESWPRVIVEFGVYSNSYDPTHWMPLPEPPK